MAIGRMQLSVRVVEQTRPRTMEAKNTALTSATNSARRAFERNRRQNDVEADRRRWTNSMLLTGPQRR